LGFTAFLAGVAFFLVADFEMELLDFLGVTDFLIGVDFFEPQLDLELEELLLELRLKLLPPLLRANTSVTGMRTERDRKRIIKRRMSASFILM